MHDETGQLFGPRLGTSQDATPINEHEEWALGFNHLLTWYVITPISVISLILNCVVLWIWNSEDRFYAIVFLFKTLAVFDTLYICFFNVWWYCPRESPASIVFDGLTFASQYMSVYTSLMIVVFRWLAAYKPVLSRKLCSRSFTQLVVGIIVGWCAIVKLIELVVRYTIADTRNYTILNVAAGQLMLHLPVLVQAALTVSLVMAMRNKRMVRSTAVASGLKDDNSHVATPPTETRRRHSCRDRGKLSKERRLNYTIFCISAMSVIAYPVTVATIGYFKLTDSHYHMSVKKVAFAVSNMVHVINSGINFFFYFAFMLEFRKLLVLSCISDETTRYHTLATTTAVASQSLSRSHSHVKVCPQANIQLLHAANMSILSSTKADGRKLLAIQEVSFDETRSLAVVRETKADGELTAFAPDGEGEGGRPAEEDGGRPAEGEGGRPAEGEADDKAG